MTETVTITGLGHRGEGIAERDGRRLFVPFTLPGEVAAIEIEGDRGTLVALSDASPSRVDPFCPYFGTCGGCALQHAGPEVYAGFKRDLLVGALQQRRIETMVSPVRDARGDGRRRATLHVTRDAAGYMRARTHDLLDIDACPILVPALRQAAPRIARTIGATMGEGDILFTATDIGLDVAVRPAKRQRPERLVPLARQLGVTRLAVAGEVIFQLASPTIRVGRSTVELPVGSFLQATSAAEEILAALVIEAVGGARLVADLFSGIGPFALRLAEGSRVAAFDSDRGSIAALNHAVRHTRGLKAVTAAARDLFRDPLAPVELARFDAVVFDPPRAGAEAQARELARSKVGTVVAVSCDPRTFARDASILIGGGYRLEATIPVDQFAWSPHVEVVGVFRR